MKASKETKKAVKKFSLNSSLKSSKSYFLILSRINWVVGAFYEIDGDVDDV